MHISHLDATFCFTLRNLRDICENFSPIFAAFTLYVDFGDADDMAKALSQVSSTVSLNKAVDSITTVTADRSVVASAYGKPCTVFFWI